MQNQQPRSQLRHHRRHRSGAKDARRRSSRRRWFALTHLCRFQVRHTGKPLDPSYSEENTELVRAGCCNLTRHIENILKFGVPVVVAINQFSSDTEAEINVIRSAALDNRDPLSKLRGSRSVRQMRELQWWLSIG